MTFRKFNHLLTTQPHDICELFISDLHLSEDTPALFHAFLAFLDDISVLPNLQKLYILGDWFELWIGDDAYLDISEEDKTNHWITAIINKLKKLRVDGCQIFIMHGNRDFLIRQQFCNEFSGKLIHEPAFITLGKNQIRLEHGDALCTDDKRYQKFRKYTRNHFVQWWLLRKPLKKRMVLANKLRNRSKKENAHKSSEIMDVNQQAVDGVMMAVDLLLHGHTHRPAVHKLDNGKIRYVLGDWRVEKADSSHQRVTAVIGAIYHEPDTNNTRTKQFELIECEYRT